MRVCACVCVTCTWAEQTEVLLVSIKAGGTGLNLVAANHVFITDLWWNSAVESQVCPPLSLSPCVHTYTQTHTHTHTHTTHTHDATPAHSHLLGIVTCQILSLVLNDFLTFPGVGVGHVAGHGQSISIWTGEGRPRSAFRD